MQIAQTKYAIFLITQISILLPFACMSRVRGWQLACPDSSQWNLRARGFCNITKPHYYCLYDANSLHYTDFCRVKEDFHKPGNKYIIRGDIDGEPCEKNRYQPFKFQTDGSTECIFKKSLCNEEGQIVQNNGNTTADNSCRCDYTNGYSFVIEPSHKCFCYPTQEDCSCFKKECRENEFLNPKYECGTHLAGEFDCPKIKTNKLKDTVTVSPSYFWDLTGFKIHRYPSQWAVLIVLLLMILFGMFGSNLINKCRQFIMMDKIIKEIAQHQKYQDVPDDLVKKDEEESIRLIKSKDTYIMSFHYTTCKFTSFNVDSILIQTIDNHVGPQTFSFSKKVLDENTGHSAYRSVHFGVEVTKLKIMQGKEIQNKHIGDWIKDDEKFIETIATIKIIERLQTDNCVLVVGPSGIGKSSIIRHIALKLRRKGYEIIPIVLSPSSIFESLNRKRKQIFVVDDLCGKVIINSKSVDVWFWQINKFMKLINTPGKTYYEDIADVKFLLATGQDIYNHRIFQKLKLLMKYVCNITDWPLTNDEKQKMIKKYITTEAETELLQTFNSDEAYFPLLCKIAERKTNDQNIKLFSNFEEFIKQDLRILKENNYFQFCHITLCALLNNNFKENILNDDYKSDFDRQALENVCCDTDFRHTKKQFKHKLKKQLGNLEEMYITKTENCYNFIHDKVYLIAVVICGQTFLPSFIKFLPTSFIAERFCFQSKVTDNDKDTISIDSEDDEKRYFDRLMVDLEQGDTYSTFHNSQLHNKSYRTKFCSYCRKHNLSELLQHFSKKNDTENETFAERLYEDYTEFTKQHDFYSHKMRKPLIETAWEGYADIVQMLLESNCAANEADELGRTSLFVACLLGKTEVVKVLLDHHADHSLCDNDGKSPLFVASRKGYNDIVNVLLQSNANVDKCDVKGDSPLIVAASANHLSTVKALSKRNTNFPKCNKLGHSPVFVACMNGREEVLRHLLTFLNQYISTPDNEGRSPLFIACSKRHFGVVKLLLENGADVSRCDQDKRSPLFIASSQGYEDIVNILIQNKAEINQYNEEGMTPLFAASEQGRTETAKILVDHGADLNKSDNKNRTPLHAACMGGSIDIVKLLCKNKASITLCNEEGSSPLFAACMQGHFDIVEYLVENGSNISEGDINETTPLLAAIEKGYTDIVNFLINRGAEIDQCDSLKRTPLHVSVVGEHVDIINVLINHGALQTLTDNNNHTPFDLACKNSGADIVKLLCPDK